MVRARAVHGLPFCAKENPSTRPEAKRAPAHVSQTGAVEKLEEALELVRAAREQEQQNDAADQRAELQRAYEALARRQDGLKTQTRQAAGDSPLDAQARREVQACREESGGEMPPLGTLLAVQTPPATAKGTPL